MPTTLFRVVNQGLISRSLLIDKIDRSQGNFEGYAQKAKQAVYVPLNNPNDLAVKGYIDMVPTDEVLLSSVGKGTLAKLTTAGHVTVTAFNSTLKATAVISNAVNAATLTTITGTTMASLAPDITYITLTNLSGVTQTLTDLIIIGAGGSNVFTTTSIVIEDALVTIGTPTTGWKVQVKANSKQSNVFTL